MKGIICLYVLTVLTSPVYSQIIGRIYLNENEFKSEKYSINYFSFAPLSSKLTKEGKKFLNDFVSFYSKNETSDDSLKIIIVPSMTIKEYKIVDNQIDLARARTVSNYLNDELGISFAGKIIRNHRDRIDSLMITMNGVIRINLETKSIK